jgi:hypothetical protein
MDTIYRDVTIILTQIKVKKYSLIIELRVTLEKHCIISDEYGGGR